jgi:exonuclease SbcC
MMLKKIKIGNFQNHKETTTEFHPGVNVIVGKSESGKSAIMRALRWLIFNLPSGDDFRSYWGGETFIDAEFSDGDISRIRKPSFNGYVLGMHDEFKGFGRQVPEPIADFLNIDKLNFQSQLDAPFMLSWSPSERGNFLNQIANLSDIGDTIDANKRTIREEQKGIAICEGQIEDAKRRADDFDWLDDCENDLAQLEAKERRFLKLSTQREGLGWLLEDIERESAVIDEYTEALEIEEEVDRLKKLYDDQMALIDRIQALDATLKNIEDEKRQIIEKKKLIAIWEKDLERLMGEVCPLCGNEV